MAHIDDLIFDARFFAAQVLAGAGAAMSVAMQAISGLGITGLPEDTPDLSAIDPPKPPSAVVLPKYGGSSFKPLNLDSLGRAPTILDPGTLLEPPYPPSPPPVHAYVAPYQPTMVPPNISQIGPAPNLDIEEIVADIPEAPELTAKIAAIPVPPMSEIVLPEAPTLTLPVFVPTTPADPGPPPTDLADQLREQFETISPIMRSTLRAEFDAFIDYYYPTLRTDMATMQARLNDFMQGGTGLTPAVEDGLYNRTIDKVSAEAYRARDTVYAEGAKLGFTIPVPFVLQQSKEVDRGYRDNLARASNEIYVENAKLEQQNIQFALTLCNNASNAHMTAAVSYHSQLVQINGQAVQYAMEIVGMVVKIYNLAIEYAKAQIALEESRIHLYEAQLKAALAQIEFYKALIEGEMAKVAVDKARVDLYTAQLNAIQVQANIYKTELEGARLRGDLEKLKVELYGENVKAFAAQVGAYSATWSGYEAAVRGAMADVSASVEQIRGYNAQADFSKTVLTSRATAIESKQRMNEANVRMYAEQVGAFRALNQASAESVKAEHDSYDLTLRTLLAEQNVRSDYYRAQVSFYDTARRALLETVQIMLEEFREANRMALGKAQAIATLSAAIGHDYAATSQAALSGLNTLAGEVKNVAATAPA